MAGKVIVRQGKRRVGISIRLKWKGQLLYISRDKRGDKFETIAHAERFRAFLSELIGSGEFHAEDWTDNRPWAWEAKADQWLQHNLARLEQQQLAPSSMREKLRMFRDYFNPFFRQSDVREIRGGNIEDFVAGLPKYLSTKSAKNLLIELRAFFRWLLRREEINRVPPIPKLKIDRPPVRWMGEEDWSKVYTCIPDEHKPLFWIMRNYGLRPGETCALRWEDFDFRKGVFHVRRTFSYGERGWVLNARPKSGSTGTLPITEGLKRVLASCGRDLGGYVFLREGKPYTQRGYDRIWRKALSMAQTSQYVSLYQATRTSFACERVNAGVPVRDIGEVMRHSDPRTTENYLSILMERKAKVIELGSQKVRKSKRVQSNGTE